MLDDDVSFELWLYRIALPTVVAIATALAVRFGEARSEIRDYARQYNTCNQELTELKK